MTKISNQYSLTNILTADLANSRLGINNVSPTVALDVTGAGKFSGALTGTTATFRVSDNRNLAIKFDTNITLSGQNDSGAPENLRIYADTFKIFTSTTTVGLTERLTISNAGNVGIGTASPIALLNIYGSNQIQLQNSTTGALASDGTRIQLSGSDLQIINRETADIILYTTDTERMRITSGGNVQIGGTTAGNFALYVKGVSSTNANFALVVNNSTPGDLFFVRNDGLINTGQQSASPYNNADTGRSVIVNSGGTLGYTSSTRESKTNIKQLSDVSWLYQLNPVSFNYRKKDNEMNYTEEFHEEKWYGLIADEVESVNEDLIFYNTKENNVKQLAGVEYSKIVPALVKAIQELSAKVSLLENK